MNVETKATPEITRAAERYLEQYGEPRSSCGVLSRWKRAALPANFYDRDAYRNFGPEYVCRYVSRLVLGHCFRAYPAPCGSSLFCFDCVALRVTVSVPDPP